MTAPAFDANDLSNSMIKACEDMTAMISGFVSAATKSSAAAWQGLNDMTSNMGNLTQESCARHMSACKSILGAKSPQEAAGTHAEYLKDCFDGMMASGSKLSEISLHAAKGAIEPLSQHANESMEAIMKKTKLA